MTIRRTTTIRGGILPTSEHLFWGAIDLVQMGNISFLFQSCDNLQPITFWILGDVVGELVCNCREHWHQLDTSTTSQHTRPSISMTLLAFINASSALLWRFKTHALPKKMPESRPEDALVHLCKLFVQNISHFYIVRYLTELTLLT